MGEVSLKLHGLVQETTLQINCPEPFVAVIHQSSTPKIEV